MIRDTMPSPEVLPTPGQIVDDRYLIEDFIGQGGMGVILRAYHQHLRHRVALKFLSPRALASSGAVERFVREARSSFALRSEHAARVFEVGALASGLPFMVMELLEGTDLRKVLRARSPIAVQEAVDWILEACEAIAEAHSRGIVHRDIKPSNLFLTRRPNGARIIKVMDFGISKQVALGGGDAAITIAGYFGGSPAYVSPEQIRDFSHVDARTDIWSLGVVLYELVTGRRPFEADSVGATLSSIAADAPVPPRTIRHEVPIGVEVAILRCLEKEPHNRFANVAGLAESLAPFASRAGQLAAERIIGLELEEGTHLLPAPPPRAPLSDAVSPIAPPVVTEARAAAQRGQLATFASVALLVALAVYAATRREAPVAAPMSARAGSTTASTPDDGLEGLVDAGFEPTDRTPPAAPELPVPEDPPVATAPSAPPPERRPPPSPPPGAPTGAPRHGSSAPSNTKPARDLLATPE